MEGDMASLSIAVRVTAASAVLAVLAASDARRLDATAGQPSPEAIVEKFLHSDEPPLVSYRATRVLEASTRGGKMTASVQALTSRDEAGRLAFEVVSATGSGLIRNRVLLAALREEQRLDNDKTGDEAALSPTNYAFAVSPESEPLVRIDIKPHSPGPMLLIGSIFVTTDAGDLVRLEGRLSKRPSFWTRSVDITRRYERILGVRVPVEMRSRADVRIVGASTFSMTYTYDMINGEPVVSRSARQNDPDTGLQTE